MTVPVQVGQNNYVANGATSVFPYTFKILDQSHVKVYKDDVLQLSGYTVSGIGNNSGGNVTFSANPTDGAQVRLERTLPVDQQLDLGEYTRFPAESVERQFDRLAMIDEQQDRKTSGLQAEFEEFVVGTDSRFDAVEQDIAANTDDIQTNIDDIAGLKQAIDSAIPDSALALALAVTDSAVLISGLTAGDLARKYGESVTITDFGAICDGAAHPASERFATLDAAQLIYPSAVSLADYLDTLAIEKAIAAVGVKGAIKLVGYPRFNRPVVYPLLAQGFSIYADNMIPVVFDNTTDGFVIQNPNENYGQNLLRNVWVIGPDSLYMAAGSSTVSTGAGVKVLTSYDNTFENVFVSGFNYGYYLKIGFNNKCVGFCGAVGNNFGVVIASGATNLNVFDNAKIRLNRVIGVVINGSGDANKPTKNSFRGAYIETNVPYFGDYLPPPNDGSHSVGVYLNETYSNDFSDVYYENQDYDVILSGSSSYNRFCRDRHAPGGSGFSRKGRIWMQGADINNNDFTGSEFVAWDSTTASVISNNAAQYGNLFVDTIGHNFTSAMLSFSNSTIRNNKPHTFVHGTRYCAITRDPEGLFINPGEGGGSGQSATITGIGTSSATLNAKGYGEIVLGSEITAPTTITSITGLRSGQIFILGNYQIGHAVTVKADASRTGGIVLAGNVDCVLDNYSDTIVFQVSGIGIPVEIARNIG